MDGVFLRFFSIIEPGGYFSAWVKVNEAELMQ